MRQREGGKREGGKESKEREGGKDRKEKEKVGWVGCV